MFGSADAYGAPFAVLLTLWLILVFLAEQFSFLISRVLLAHFEIVDAMCDARVLHASSADPAARSDAYRKVC